MLFGLILFSDGMASDSEAPSESLPPVGNYMRHPNVYLPPYSIASETEAEDNPSVRNGRNHDFSPNGIDDDDEDSPSSHSSFDSQIRRPLVSLRAAVAGSQSANRGQERISSIMGSASDVSHLCEIDDSEFEIDDIRISPKTIHRPGQPIQTDV